MGIWLLGVDHYKLKSFTPEELDIKEYENLECRLELHQAYFYVLKIPIFPTDKCWYLIKDNKEIKIPENALPNLNEIRVKSKFNIMNYSFLILILCVFIYLYLSDGESRNKNALQSNNTETEKQETDFGNSILKYLIPMKLLFIK